MTTKILSLIGSILLLSGVATAFPVAKSAWSDDEWRRRCEPVRTSYNRDTPLSVDRLTLMPADPRFLDFVYWVWGNKILEHQVEQIGGTEWHGPEDGVVFHWAPGSRWEMHTIVPLDDAIHHIADEHQWYDTMFRDFFERFGPIRHVNIKARLSTTGSPTWRQFLEHVGGPNSMYYRYIFHQEASVDPERRVVTLFGGQGVLFEYSFDRYAREAAEVLTDCKAYQFFELYDLYGQGFASKMGWAGQPIPHSIRHREAEPPVPHAHH